MVKRQDNAAADELRQAILASGLSQRDLERAAGVAGGVLSRFLSGRSGLTFDTADLFARAVGKRLRVVRVRKGK
jgi:transcriptional regulator with XRE-family HTH domain